VSHWLRLCGLVCSIHVRDFPISYLDEESGCAAITPPSISGPVDTWRSRLSGLRKLSAVGKESFYTDIDILRNGTAENAADLPKFFVYGLHGVYPTPGHDLQVEHRRVLVPLQPQPCISQSKYGRAIRVGGKVNSLLQHPLTVSFSFRDSNTPCHASRSDSSHPCANLPFCSHAAIPELKKQKIHLGQELFMLNLWPQPLEPPPNVRLLE
jgi:hypothetical protein